MSSSENKIYNIKPQTVIQNLQKQKTEGIFCDVKLCLQGTIMWVHACVLAPFSSFIMEHFRTTHWCHQKPLVIDLDIVISVSQDKCSLCLSTLIDLMYSQDIVILDGHLQHFSKMIYYLKIDDLLPLFKKYLYDTKHEEPNVQEFSEDCTPDNDILKTAKNCKSSTLLKPSPYNPTNTLLSNNSTMSNSHQEQHDKKQQTTNKSRALNQSYDNVDNVPSCTKNSLSSVSLTLQNLKVKKCTEVIEEHNYGSREATTLEPKCEFLCCTGEIVPSNASINHRRKISCEMCSFTAVAVKKLVKHIESTSHLGTVCPICTQKFQNTDSLQQHLKDHNNSKPYLCQFCPKRTRFWEFYKSHLKVHCRNKNVFCEICQKSFKSQRNLNIHLKSHKRNYLCNSCNYLTSDADAFKAHLLIHEGKSAMTSDTQTTFDSFVCISDNDLVKHKTAIQFLCSSCGEGFTQKSNLKRHVELKHSNVPNFDCDKCSYATKRTDLLKIHMKRHHNCLPEEIKCSSQKVTKRVSKKQKWDKDQSGVVGVLIPVQLVLTNNSSTVNAYAVKTYSSGKLESVEGNRRKMLKSNENDRPSSTNINSISVLEKHPVSINLVEKKFDLTENSHSNDSLETLHPMACSGGCKTGKEISEPLLKNNDASLENDFTGSVQSIKSCVTNPKINLNSGNLLCSKNIDLTQPILNMAQEFNDLQIDLEEGNTNLNSIQVVESNLITRSGEFWLNETTGEFLNENSLVNLQMIDTSCQFNNLSGENPHENTVDPLQALILTDPSKAVSILDLRDDVDELKSNPQTPQTNLVEVDDPDNLFPWSCIDSSFCSTWVLNEATGELNMVSFNVQPIKHSDESKLDENTGMFSLKDDDETALFLNEGTGDLSVIYFNPSKQEWDSSKHFYNEHDIQDVPDNVSEHSNDEDNFLNAEFFKATASFMAHKENETFLNELTGEFDINIADFNNYHPDMIENQISGSEAYLNEETGEILGNALNKNVGSDFFTNSESFKYDLDDSLNCDDFEPFVDGMNDFSSQFCLETVQDWQSVDETCDIMLNECTGELIKKSL